MSYPKQPEGPAMRVGQTDVYQIEIRVFACNKCKRHMVLTNMGNNFEAFPWLKPAVMKQLEAAGITLGMTFGSSSGGPLCSDCAGDEAVYECYGCDQKINKDQIQESFGWPQEHLCKHCYEKVPAKQWDKWLEELQESHRYDFNA